MSIEFLNESGFDGVNEEMLIDVATFAFGAMDIHPDAECTITAVDLDTIADLHVRWMDLDGPTDVMSFPMDELTPGATGGRPDSPDPGPAMLGDIVLCPEFALRQAEAADHSLGHELALLTVHGCLHLLGYDHRTPAEEKEMFGLQNELLADWYDNLAERNLTFHPKPSGPKAFPDAAERAALDKEVPGGGIPPIAEPSENN
ncbi:Endoribonuclease YbeY [Corynebacterium camporealensis]|uniref:Endoribonuclease YbeY n=1 Tax=Corynebacterium camporealensis TaxID=161896 RepID=A0A0F6QWW9_9CORY|nr:rRNA maturation RNase YbeY [Corynebacterium camporealensis]AKE39652.1 putative rRNA maturation factor YbeY [Corynebacterium camporealensis]AVH88783.1 Endoribonuclease YbeY [Corynebacterium camporealensis]